MHPTELLPHLFRREYGKIVAVLCRTYGFPCLDTAEDIASDTFLTATETWTYHGIPANPTAWLYTVAKNKAKNQLRRHQVFHEKVKPLIAAAEVSEEMPFIDLTETNITDSQLRMLFALSHPSIQAESRVALSLRILCGFSIEEIAHALLSHRETVHKRLQRAKEKLRALESLDFPSAQEIPERLENVLTTLYLLFNEGYYSETDNRIIRDDLCLEAMRLTSLLLGSPVTNQPSVHALMALMCFHASRFKARKMAEDELTLYEEQDPGLWDHDLIIQGMVFLKQSAEGEHLSRYHLEAHIAYWHTIQNDHLEKWTSILHLYDHLLKVIDSPIAAFNRLYAFAKVHGNEAALAEAGKIHLEDNPYYFTLLGVLHEKAHPKKALACYEQAMQVVSTKKDRNAIEKRLQMLRNAMYSDENTMKF